MNKKLLTILDWIARIGIAIILILYGLDKWLPFMPHPVSTEAGIAFKQAMKNTGYLFLLVGLTEVVAGLFLLSNKLIKIGLIITAPLIVNFLGYHLWLEPENIPGALAITIGVLYMTWIRRREFRPLFQ